MPTRRKSNKKVKDQHQLNLFGDEFESVKPVTTGSKPKARKKAKKKSSKKEKIENLLAKARKTENLINESEFDGFYYQPTQIYEIILDNVKEDEENLPDFNKIIKSKNIIKELDSLLDYDFFNEFIERLQKLIHRAQSKKDLKIAKKVQPIMELFDLNPSLNYLLEIGLFRKILNRNFELGLRITQLMKSVTENGKVPLIDSVNGKSGTISEGLAQIAEHFPGFEDYLNEELSFPESVTEVADILIKGEVYLGIFSGEEIKRANEELKQVVTQKFNVTVPGEIVFSVVPLLSEEQMTLFNMEVEKYAINLINEELLESIYDEILELIEEEELEDELLDLFDEFLDDFVTLKFSGLVLIVMAILLSEMHIYYNEKNDPNGPYPDNMFTLN